MLIAKTATAQTRLLLTAHSIGLNRKSVKVKPIYIVRALLAADNVDLAFFLSMLPISCLVSLFKLDYALVFMYLSMRVVSTFMMYQYPEGQSEYTNSLALALLYYDSDRADKESLRSVRTT